MPNLTIYHNPRCSKSRPTLALIEEAGITPEVRLYLEKVPSTDELTTLIGKLGISPRDLLRKGEQDFKDQNLKNPELSDADIIEAMTQYPKLIERPIVVSGTKAVLGRPPENVKALL
jgi:arsenate reductase